MKIRMGFVSNSSSSSFTCNCCGQTESGMDLCLSEAGMVRCIEDHVFCEGHEVECSLTRRDQLEALLEIWCRSTSEWERNQATEIRKKLEEAGEDPDEVEFIVDQEMEEIECDLGVVPSRCPICTMQDMTDWDMISYLCWKIGVQEREAKEMYQREFSSYTEFKRVMEEHRQ